MKASLLLALIPIAIVGGVVFLALFFLIEGSGSATYTEAEIEALAEQLHMGDAVASLFAEEELKSIGQPAIPVLRSAISRWDYERLWLEWYYPRAGMSIGSNHPDVRDAINRAVKFRIARGTALNLLESWGDTYARRRADRKYKEDKQFYERIWNQESFGF